MSDDVLLLVADTETESSNSSDGHSSTSVVTSATTSPVKSTITRPPASSSYSEDEPLLLLSDLQLSRIFEKIKKSARLWMAASSAGGGPNGSSAALSGPSSPNSNHLSELLAQKERDLELAAKIGQSLLEHNKDLQARNEFLEENLAASTDVVVQLRHELQQRIELLRVYSRYDEDNVRTDSDENLKRKVTELNDENRHLRAETASLKRLAESAKEKEAERAMELSRQLDVANEKITHLHIQILEKNEECAVQAETVERLLQEIASKNTKERDLNLENEELNRQLDEAIFQHESMQNQMMQLQDQYTELRGIFYEAEEELVKLRHDNQKRTGSFDSLYDSLASELENSDSGVHNTPAVSSRNVPLESLNLRLELQRLKDEKEKSASRETIDIPSSVLADLARHKIAITGRTPPQTPCSIAAESRSLTDAIERASASMTTSAVEAEIKRDGESPKEAEYAADEEMVDSEQSSPRKLCDASTSCLDIRSASAHSTPPPEMQQERLSLQQKQALLEFSTPQCIAYEASAPCVNLSQVQSTASSSTSSACSSVSDSAQEKPRRPLFFERRPTLLTRNSMPDLYAKKGDVMRTSSDDSLDGYEVPKLGQPGIPGTRDLTYSIRMLKARRQVERDYAEFRRRKGYAPSQFFSARGEKSSSPLEDSQLEKSQWSTNDTPKISATTSAAPLTPSHALLGLENLGIVGGAATSPLRQDGIVSRRLELSSPSAGLASFPLTHHSYLPTNGLLSSLLSTNPTTHGIVLRRAL